MNYRLTELAAENFRAVVRHATKLYGADQARRYGALLRHAIMTIANTPDRAIAREELGPGICVFPAALVADGTGAVPHVIFCRVANDGTTEILRILHGAIEPLRHLRP